MAGKENRIFLMSDYFSQGGLNTYLASMKRLLVCADSSTSVHLFFSKTRIFVRIASKVVGGYSIIDCIPKSRKRLHVAVRPSQPVLYRRTCPCVMDTKGLNARPIGRQCPSGDEKKILFFLKKPLQKISLYDII